MTNFELKRTDRRIVKSKKVKSVMSHTEVQNDQLCEHEMGRLDLKVGHVKA